jgi:hypothetical protein
MTKSVLKWIFYLHDWLSRAVPNTSLFCPRIHPPPHRPTTWSERRGCPHQVSSLPSLSFSPPPAATHLSSLSLQTITDQSQASHHLFPLVAGAVTRKAAASFLLSGKWVTIIAIAHRRCIRPAVLTSFCHHAYVVRVRRASRRARCRRSQPTSPSTRP